MATCSSSLENAYKVANYMEDICGRVIRLSKDKTAEFFTLVINDSIETEWMNKSRSDNNFIMIDVENLMHLLKGEPWVPYKKKLQNYTYRF